MKTFEKYEAPFAEITVFSSEAFMSGMWSGEHDTFPDDTSAFDYGGDEEP